MVFQPPLIYSSTELMVSYFRYQALVNGASVDSPLPPIASIPTRLNASKTVSSPSAVASLGSVIWTVSKPAATFQDRLVSRCWLDCAATVGSLHCLSIPALPGSPSTSATYALSPSSSVPSSSVPDSVVPWPLVVAALVKVSALPSPVGRGSPLRNSSRAVDVTYGVTVVSLAKPSEFSKVKRMP